MSTPPSPFRTCILSFDIFQNENSGYYVNEVFDTQFTETDFDLQVHPSLRENIL